MKQSAIVGIDLGGTNIRSGKVRNDTIVKSYSSGISSQESEEVVVKEVISAIDKVFDAEIAGIGIGVPSLVDVEKGIVYAVQNIPSWKEVPLKEILEAHFKVPVYVNNDANCFALGECHFGKGRDFHHIIGITLGTGLGAGIIIDRRLYSGANCGAGEIGTIPYKEQTVEYYCSGQFFSRNYGVSGRVLYERAQKGDSNALHAFREFGNEMSHALMTALYAFDPEIVIFGGSVSQAFPFFEKAMRENLVSFAYQHALERLVIDRSERPDIALLGGAALYLDSLAKA